ncbi:hypothetical protein GTX23_25550, partial [Streptomyces sp. SID6139]|nr:hypothetical protein [Streptomyces sp. SID6139]
VHLPTGTTVTAVAAGLSHSLALTSDGRVLAWGYNAFGQLGDGTTTERLTPVEADLPIGTTVTALSAGAVLQPGGDLRRRRPGLGLQPLRSAGRQHHHQPLHTGRGAPARRNLRHLRCRRRLSQPGRDHRRTRLRLGLQRLRAARRRHHDQPLHTGGRAPAHGHHRHRRRRR